MSRVVPACCYEGLLNIMITSTKSRVTNQPWGYLEYVELTLELLVISDRVGHTSKQAASQSLSSLGRCYRDESEIGLMSRVAISLPFFQVRNELHSLSIPWVISGSNKDVDIPYGQKFAS